MASGKTFISNRRFRGVLKCNFRTLHFFFAEARKKGTRIEKGRKLRLFWSTDMTNCSTSTSFFNDYSRAFEILLLLAAVVEKGGQKRVCVLEMTKFVHLLFFPGKRNNVWLMGDCPNVNAMMYNLLRKSADCQCSKQRFFFLQSHVEIFGGSH